MVRVVYQGMVCDVLAATSHYPARLQITDPKDITQATSLGFTCLGYPTEIAKELTEEEYKHFLFSLLPSDFEK